MELGTIIAIVTSAVGATWVIHGKLSDIEKGFATYRAKHEEEHKAIRARIVQLEPARKKGR